MLDPENPTRGRRCKRLQLRVTWKQCSFYSKMALKSTPNLLSLTVKERCRQLQVRAISISYSSYLAEVQMSNATPVCSCGKTALQAASIGGHLEVVRLLLENGAEVKARCKSGRAALHYAAGSGHSEIVRLLPDNGASAQTEDYKGRLAIMLAREQN
jgi:predicted LPLAT superfamily acyltransferase